MDAPSDTSKILEKGPDYLRKQMELEGELKGPMSAVERLAASKLCYVKSQRPGESAPEPLAAAPAASDSPPQARRSGSKKRPDSILLYRQKCDLLRAPGKERKHHVARKLYRSSVKKSAALPEAAGKEGRPDGEDPPGARTPTPERRRQDADANPEDASSPHLSAVPAGRGKGVARSRSDISSRYSKNFADFDAFFKYCGLDGEVIESLGKENFSARSDETALKLRSVSASTSDGGFSRDSDASDGLQEDALRHEGRQGTSVVERNARIIKWLYSCKNAKESGQKLRDLH